MPSPFPGMDPFLERKDLWVEVHDLLIAAIRYQLIAHLPDGYEVRMQASFYLHEVPYDGRRLMAVADDAIVRPAAPFAQSGSGGATAVVGTAAQPTHRGVLLPHVFERKESFLEVRDAEGGQVVTVVELLSRANKMRHRNQYLAKRDAILHAPAHLFELDLLRAGRPHDLGQTESGPIVASTPYRCLKSRAATGPDHSSRLAEIWQIGLRDHLPIVPVPLKGDESVPLDLRAALDRVFDESRYERSIYRRPPDPPLSPADADWAAGVLNAAGVPLPPEFPPPSAAAPDSAE